jgi:hypothetical protein
MKRWIKGIRGKKEGKRGKKSEIRRIYYIIL